ncbi:Uncharacterised protein [Yersinia enterocolitica]|nr:Uncharacterised protein [Yersinia enterocolitica]
MQQAAVDVVALGQHFIQFHGTQNSTEVSHGQVDDSQFQIADFICGFHRVNNLNKADGINCHIGVVAGNDFLGWNIQNLFHHIDFTTNTIHKWHNDIQARHQCFGITAKTLDCPLKTLWDDFD